VAKLARYSYDSWDFDIPKTLAVQHPLCSLVLPIIFNNSTNVNGSNSRIIRLDIEPTWVYQRNSEASFNV
jgi:hypothetical protein